MRLQGFRVQPDQQAPAVRQAYLGLRLRATSLDGGDVFEAGEVELAADEDLCGLLFGFEGRAAAEVVER